MSISLKKFKKLPDAPGVYLFLKAKSQKLKAGNVLYIGKATSLRDRVRSYFSGDIEQARGPLIVKMLEEATDVEVEETDSVLEALVQEAQLIKKYQPPYNTREKSDKSFNYVVITDEEYPRVFTVRERDLQAISHTLKASYGPFPYGAQLREALRIVRRIFPFRGEKDAVEQRQKGKSSLRREIGLVPDFTRVHKREYKRTIKHVRLFFEGKKKKLLTELEKEMKTAAKAKEFERAETVKRQVFALRHIRDVSLLKREEEERAGGYSNVRTNIRIEAYDVAHTGGMEPVGVMVVVLGGTPQKGSYRKFKVKSAKSKSDTDALKEILGRRLEHQEWQLPKCIVVDGGKAQINAAEKVLKGFGYGIPVVSVVKDDRHRPKRVLGSAEHARRYERDIIIANGEAHRFALSFHRKRRGEFDFRA